MVPEPGAFVFGRKMTWSLIFRERYKRSVTPNTLRSIVVSLQPGCFEEARKVKRLADTKATGGERMSGNAMERGA